MRTGSDFWPEFMDQLRGRRVALVSHPAAVDAHRVMTVEKCLRTPGMASLVLWSVEHGYWGNYQDMEPVPEGMDAGTGLHVVSLYRSDGGVRPPSEALDSVDLVLFDMQDVGTRYYTFFHTLAGLLECLSGADAEIWVLDRPNPLGGKILEGPVLRPYLQSFVGSHPIPVRHGLTACEFATLFVHERGLSCSLRCIPMEGWNRNNLWPRLKRPWVPPSPNMPSFMTALVYPGMCLLEATNISEGRGTTCPFLWFGAPGIDPFRLTRSLNDLALPGVYFRPHVFRPQFQKHTGVDCGGAEIHVLDARKFRPFRTGLHVLQTLYTMYPDLFRWREDPYEFVSGIPALDLLCGDERVREAIDKGKPLAPLEREWNRECRQWWKKTQGFRIYPS